MSFRRKPSDPAPEDERREAAIAAAALHASIANKAAAGTRSVVHLDMRRPRRAVWLATWSNLPGLTMDIGRKVYTHSLLPGWEYNVREMKTELIEDLERIAMHGERPAQATRRQVRP